MTVLFRSALLAGALATAACSGGSPPTPAKPMPDNGGESVRTVGDITVRANAMQTSALNEAVARGYGIERSDKTAMLLVGVRKGQGAAETSVPARVTVRVAGLGGAAREIEMRELRTGGAAAGSGQALTDYIGTMQISLPDTLRFDIDVAVKNGQTVKVQFSREFYPR